MTDVKNRGREGSYQRCCHQELDPEGRTEFWMRKKYFGQGGKAAQRFRGRRYLRIWIMVNDFCLGAFEYWKDLNFKFYLIIIRGLCTLKSKRKRREWAIQGWRAIWLGNDAINWERDYENRTR